MESYHVDCNFQDVEEPSCHVDGRVYNVRVDEVQQFIEVYSVFVEYDVM